MRLTDEQAYFAMRQMSRWLRLRVQHESNLRIRHPDPRGITQLAADVDHSALLLRLLRGREPLPEPPPLEHAYPLYPDYPYEDDPE